MGGRLARWLGLVLVSLVLVPPVIGLLIPDRNRNFEAIRLDETVFEEVRFANEQQGLLLGGLVFEPIGVDRFPAAVIIQGSGPSHRENGWYLTLVDFLQSQGILVLLPDKRGSADSEGEGRSSSFDDLATDAEAALKFLDARYEASITSLGVIGMSQGGRIAPLVANGDARVDWVVNVVGGALPSHASLRYEEVHNLRELGFLPGVADVLSFPSSWSLIYLRDRLHWAAVGDFDPMVHWAKVDQAVLIVYGEDDTNVPTEASVIRLESLNSENIEVIVYEGSGHAIEDPDGEGNSIFRADALEEIAGFISRADPMIDR